MDGGRRSLKRGVGLVRAIVPGIRLARQGEIRSRYQSRIARLRSARSSVCVLLNFAGHETTLLIEMVVDSSGNLSRSASNISSRHLPMFMPAASDGSVGLFRGG